MPARSARTVVVQERHRSDLVEGDPPRGDRGWSSACGQEALNVRRTGPVGRTGSGASGRDEHGEEGATQRRSMEASADELKAFVLGEVGVVLDVECGEGQLAGDAAGGDPGVVDWSGSAAESGLGLDLAPYRCCAEAAGQDDDAGEEGLKAGSPLWSPAVQACPLGQFADGDEGDREPLTGQWAGEGVGQLALEDGRGDVGVDDDVGSREAGAAGDVEVGEEGLVLLVGFPEVGWASSSTDLIGLMPWRRASSSVDTKSSRGQASGCSGVLVTWSPPVDPWSHPGGIVVLPHRGAATPFMVGGRPGRRLPRCGLRRIGWAQWLRANRRGLHSPSSSSVSRRTGVHGVTLSTASA